MSTATATRSAVATPAKSCIGSYPPGIVPARDHTDFLAFTNGLLDIRRFLAGEPHYLQPLTPLWFSNICMDYPFDPLADCPRWKNVLTENLEGDGQRIALLQEWAGYLILPDTSQQKFMVLEGEGANGKSVYCAMLRAMLSDEAVSHVPLECFGQRFALHSTIGRLVNIAADCGEIDRAAEGILKSFTSGDRMFFDRKNREPVFDVPTARMMLATNNLPRFSDRSSGLWRRMLICPFRVSIPEGRQVRGMDRASFWLESGEAPGLFLWALDGLKRLRENKGFTTPNVCREALESYRRETNPAREFLTDCVREIEVGRIGCQDLYGYYCEWCKKSGYRALNASHFGREVRRRFPKIEIPRLQTGDSRTRFYDGLCTVGDF